jgi:hypothetical protein
MKSSRIAISPTTETLSLVECNSKSRVNLENAELYWFEGDLKQRFNDEGEEFGYFADHFVGLRLDGIRYVNNEFCSWGHASRTEADNFIQRIKDYGSVNLGKWSEEVTHDYLQSCAHAERLEREAEGIFY